MRPWNKLTSIEKHWREPLRQSIRKKAKITECSEQQDDAQQDFFGIDDNIHLDNAKIDFE